MIATIKFENIEESLDLGHMDIHNLCDKIMMAFNQNFEAYKLGASALSQYNNVRIAVAGDDCLTLFGAAEALRAGLEADPLALAWSTFEQQAAASIAPVGFSIRFSVD